MAETPIPPRVGSARQSSANGTIVGEVVHLDGIPLPYANVTVETSALGACADERGEFSIREVPVGTYRLRVSCRGFKDVILDSVPVGVDRTTYVGTVTLARKTLHPGDPIEIVRTETRTVSIPPGSYEPGRIIGKVLRADGTPVSNADVVVEGTTLSQATDTSGSFCITGVPSEIVYRIWVSMTGFADVVIGSVPVMPDLTTDVGIVRMVEGPHVRGADNTGSLESDAPITARLGKIVGKVVRTTGTPLPYAKVIVEGMAVGHECDSRGDFAIVGITPGTYRVKVSSRMGLADAIVDSVVVLPGLTTNLGDIRMTAKKLVIGGETVVVATRHRIVGGPTPTMGHSPGESLSSMPVMSFVEEISRIQARADSQADSPGGTRIEAEAEPVPSDQAQSTEGNGGEQ
jgi:hypothetical protein